MQKVSTSFFNPANNLKKFNISTYIRPDTLKRSNALYKVLWLRKFRFLYGKNRSTVYSNNSTDAIYVEPFFGTAFDLIDLLFFKNNDHVRLTSTLGLFHYLNPFVPLALLSLYASVKMKQKALEKYNYDDGWEKNNFLLYAAYGLFALTGLPLLEVSVVTQVYFTFAQALLAATVVTLTSFLWYPVAYLQTVKIDKQKEEEKQQEYYDSISCEEPCEEEKQQDHIDTLSCKETCEEEKQRDNIDIPSCIASP